MKIKVDKEEFSIIKSRKTYPKAFANVRHNNEITVITKDKIDEKDIISIENGWKLITFDMTLEFSMVGFIAKVSEALAKHNISIFVISSYSTDHVLVKKENLNEATKILEGLK